MNTKITKIDAENIDDANIREAADLIERGDLVAFPTETVYGIACRVKAEPLRRLDELKKRSAEKYYTLHIGKKSAVEEYVPSVRLRTRKLIENFWPGALTIVFQLSGDDIKKQHEKFDDTVFECLYRNNTIGIRCPDHPVASRLLCSVDNPVVAPSANLSGRKPAVNAKQVIRQLDGQIDMLLDAGACRYKKNSTVVKASLCGIEILRAGVLSIEEIEGASKVRILFVCTGNTCRSPMAEGLFKKYIAEKIGCSIDQLQEKGYKIGSAGTMGLVGLPATAEAVAACAREGVDLSSHMSSALTPQLIEESDFIFVMGRSHHNIVAAAGREAAKKCHLLAGDMQIADPIGQRQIIYDQCARSINEAVKKRISELVI